MLVIDVVFVVSLSLVIGKTSNWRQIISSLLF
jgi:hypothetical protein